MGDWVFVLYSVICLSLSFPFLSSTFSNIVSLPDFITGSPVDNFNYLTFPFNFFATGRQVFKVPITPSRKLCVATHSEDAKYAALKLTVQLNDQDCNQRLPLDCVNALAQFNRDIARLKDSLVDKTYCNSKDRLVNTQD